MIHPVSSGLQGWGQVLGHSSSLDASPLFVVIIPPLLPNAQSFLLSFIIIIPPSPSGAGSFLVVRCIPVIHCHHSPLLIIPPVLSFSCLSLTISYWPCYMVVLGVVAVVCLLLVIISGWGGGRWWSSGSHCLPPVFLSFIVLCVLIIHCWHWSAEC